MVLCRMNGTYPVRSLRQEMDRVFNDVFEGVASGFTPAVFGRRVFPAFNLWEDDLTLFAEAEVPGLRMDDLEVFVNGDELTVKGERKPGEEEGVTYHRRERGVGTFSRGLRLPVEVDAEKVEASLRDGVLTIRLPKAQAVIPRKITVTES